MNQLIPTLSRRNSHSIGKADAAPFSARRSAVWLLFVLACMGVATATCVSAYLTALWSARWFMGGEQGGWHAFLPMFLGGLSSFYSARWMILLVLFGIG